MDPGGFVVRFRLGESSRYSFAARACLPFCRCSRRADILGQSTAFVEDLFFHESHVKGLRTLLQHDRVAFSIRRNPLTVRPSLSGLRAVDILLRW